MSRRVKQETEMGGAEATAHDRPVTYVTKYPDLQLCSICDLESQLDVRK